MDFRTKYFIGVDGGGSGTRLVLLDDKKNILSIVQGEPSALGQGIEKAWKSIIECAVKAFTQCQIVPPMLSECEIGVGISGANNINWKNEFIIRNPGFKKLIVDTDGYTTLLGAHGKPNGLIIAIGTGSVGLCIDKHGNRKTVSGWGFPSGDEASGAWLGLKACQLTQKVFDKREDHSALSELVMNECGNSEEIFLKWLGNANQNTFASLAPLVFEAASKDPKAESLLNLAAKEVELMIKTLDQDLSLPISICGRLGEKLIPYLNKNLQDKIIKPQNDSAHGAIFLIENETVW